MQDQKIHLFKVAPQYTRSTPSYLLLVREMADDILKKLEKKIASLQAGMRAKMMMKLLPPPSVLLKRYYKFEGDAAPVPAVSSLHYQVSRYDDIL